MLSSLTLKNFKSHRETTLELGRLNVLVGPNGAGKTSVLQAVELLSQLLESGEAPTFIERLVHAGARSTEVQVAFTPSGEPRPVSNAPRKQQSSEARLRVSLPGGEASAQLGDGDEVQFSLSHHDPTLKALRASFDVKFLRLQGDRVAEPPSTLASLQGSKDSVWFGGGDDGRHTANILASLKLDADETFDRIQMGLRALVPYFERVRLKQSVTVQLVKEDGTPIDLEAAGVHLGELTIRRQLVPGYALLFDFKNAKGLEAHLVSEGTLVMLALLTAIASSSGPKIVLIDDLGLALHPTAQLELVRQLRALLEREPELQIIATTHSPYILDRLEPEEVFVCFPGAEGTVVRKLSEHPAAARAKESMTTGELWTYEPEDWVARAPS
ncbi:MAG: ATP-binding protein [Polyangiaceae bacterium]